MTPVARAACAHTWAATGAPLCAQNDRVVPGTQLLWLDLTPTPERASTFEEETFLALGGGQTEHVWAGVDDHAAHDPVAEWCGPGRRPGAEYRGGEAPPLALSFRYH